jgi:hypothetical protein
MDIAAPVNRVYRMQYWLMALALLFLAFGSLFLIKELRELTSGELELKPLDVVVGTVFFAVGFFLTIRFYSSRVKFTSDAIERSNIFNSARLPYSAIRGRREYVVRGGEDGGETHYLKLEPNDDRFPALDFIKAYNFDDAFYSWFNQLPDLDEEDKTGPKTSNFGLV